MGRCNRQLWRERAIERGFTLQAFEAGGDITRFGQRGALVNHRFCLNWVLAFTLGGKP